VRIDDRRREREKDRRREGERDKKGARGKPPCK
jgi:hypothetical protein